MTLFLAMTTVLVTVQLRPSVSVAFTTTAYARPAVLALFCGGWAEGGGEGVGAQPQATR